MKATGVHLVILTFISFLFFSANASAETYFVDSDKGDDKSGGTREIDAWKTLERVNAAHFSPGDEILFKRGRQWRGKLIVSSSGSKGRPITFGAYGVGKNPVIMRTVVFLGWKPLKNAGGLEKKARVWVGRIPMLNNSWGMVKDDRSIPTHIRRQLIGSGVNTLADGYYYSPVNSGLFYYRNDAGKPGSVEIGAHDEAIHIESKSHIVIDGVDVFGPGGKQKHSPGSAKGLNYKSVAISKGSSHILIRNLSISHANSIGIHAGPTTSDIVYENLSVHHNGGTGIYMNSKGGMISGCRSFENGRLDNGIGDRGGIGSFRGKNITIEGNEVFRNGPDNGGADFEVSLVSTGTIKIQRNYIHDCLQGCLQVAAGGNGSIIAYNVISGYGTAKGKMSSLGKLSGIRIGGGGAGSKNIHIYNNVLHGGKQAAHTLEAALFISPFDNSGLRVVNNVFANNENKHVHVVGGKRVRWGDLQFSNNLFWPSESGVHWQGTNFRTLKYLQDASSLGADSVAEDPLFSNTSGKFTSVLDFSLQRDSPAIDRGAYLGIAGDYNNKFVPNGISPDIGAFERYSKD